MKKYAWVIAIVLAWTVGVWMFVSGNEREQISEVKVMNILPVVVTQEVCYQLGHVKRSGKPWFERLSKVDMVLLDGTLKPLKNAYSALEEATEEALSKLDTTNSVQVNQYANECALNNAQFRGLDIYVEQ